MLLSILNNNVKRNYYAHYIGEKNEVHKSQKTCFKATHLR